MPSGEGTDHSLRLNAARVAYADARYDDALAGLDGCEDWPIALAEFAVLLKAETLLRRDNAAALAWLAATNDLVATGEATFQRELLTARALGNVRNFNGAEERINRARALLEHVPGGAPKVAFQTARLKWFRREATPGDEDIALALTDPDPAARAAAFSVRAWSHAALGDYRAQIADLSEALRVAASAGYRCDVATLGTIVHSLARIAFEIADAEGMAVARAAYEGIRWTSDVRVHQFQTLRALGLDAFMRGEVARAQWLFRDASAVAPTPPFVALAHLDRSFVARIMHNEAWALDELDEAVRIARGVAWGQTFGEERIALVALATLLAPTNAAEAQRHAATYSMLGVESVSPMFALSQEKRAVAAETFALARIDQTLGNTESAERGCREAYAVYEPIEHHYQAMLIATTLKELTGDPHWTERALLHASHYPGCPIGNTTRQSNDRVDPVYQALTPLQRQIARAHWSGADAAALSAQFSRSRYTVEHQLAAIYDAFGVDAAGTLRNEAVRRGLV